MAKLKLQLRLMLGEEIAFGPGKADLLEAIGETGSISAAGQHLGMSYRRTWLLVDTMNRCFREPLVETATGGSKGGGTRLTESGIDMLKQYRRMQASALKVVEPHFTQMNALLAKSARPAASQAKSQRRGKAAAKSPRKSASSKKP